MLRPKYQEARRRNVKEKHSTELEQAARHKPATSLALIPKIQPEAAERPASPAATNRSYTQVLDQSRAIRGRVHAVVGRRYCASRLSAMKKVQLPATRFNPEPDGLSQSSPG